MSTNSVNQFYHLHEVTHHLELFELEVTPVADDLDNQIVQIWYEISVARSSFCFEY